MHPTSAPIAPRLTPTSLDSRSDSPRPRGDERDRIAVVDDDECTLRTLSTALGMAGFETSCFLTPVQALAHIGTSAPTVVLSDYAMPEMDGIAFLGRVRALAPGTVRVLCTAGSDFRIALEAVNSGEVYRIVAKPWRLRDLVTLVREAVEEARRQRDEKQLVGRLSAVNAELKELVARRTKASFEALIAALDCRDSETLSHSLRVTRFARRLARQLGICTQALEVLEEAALLHDIGKIGVCDRVLLKPGPLSPEERAEMMRHAEMGWALLQRLDHLKPASVIVLQHHERWDGSGYPKGLRRDEIDIGARVFHVADALDAMTSRRSYRTSWSFVEADREVRRLREVQFDPAVVDAFAAVDPGEWEAIRAEGASQVTAVASARRHQPPERRHEHSAGDRAGPDGGI